MKMNKTQSEAIKAYWVGCIARKSAAGSSSEPDKNHAWATGQMDGFERAIAILTGGDPIDTIAAAMEWKEENQPKSYTRLSYDVHTSVDGEKWFSSRTFLQTPEGLKEAQTYANELSQTQRHARVAQVEKVVTILVTIENIRVLSQQQINDLLKRGKAATADIKGITVTEGFSISFDPKITHGPTRVTASFYAATILGKRPVVTGASTNAVRAHRKEWDKNAAIEEVKALDAAQAKLQAAGIRIKRYSHEIELFAN